MINLSHITEGWGKSMGLLEVSAAERALSVQRMAICQSCPLASESSFLKLIRGSANNIPAIYCTACSCPVNEKSLVTNETCPKGKW